MPAPDQPDPASDYVQEPKPSVQLGTEAVAATHVAAHWGEVATVWGVSDGQVKDDVSDYSVVDPGPADGVRSVPYRRDDAKRLMLEILVNRCNASRRSRKQVLKDFDADMRHRAAESKRKK